MLADLTRRLTGKLYADKGYLGKEPFQQLWQRGLYLIEALREVKFPAYSFINGWRLNYGQGSFQ